jgi:hypothetical protein
MSTNSSSQEKLPGSRRGSFREFFLAVGAGLLLLAGAFYLRGSGLPHEILGIVGGAGLILLLIGFLWPAPRPLTTQENRDRTLQEGEDILRTGPASHQVGWENRGGTLTLTGRRLTFFSHGLNVQNADLIIPLADIARVEQARTLGIIPNAFRVITLGGARHQFTVFTRRPWIEAIEGACSLSEGSTRS